MSDHGNGKEERHEKRKTPTKTPRTKKNWPPKEGARAKRVRFFRARALLGRLLKE